MCVCACVHVCVCVCVRVFKIYVYETFMNVQTYTCCTCTYAYKVYVRIIVTSSDSVECCRRSLVLCPSDEIILAHIVFSCSSGQCADKPRDPGLVSLGSEGLLCIGGEEGGGT